MYNNIPINKELAINAFRMLNDYLEKVNIKCDICIYGGSALIFINNLRKMSYDVDYRIVSIGSTGNNPTESLDMSFRIATMDVGEELGLDISWMNDAVKIFASRNEEYGESMSFGSSLTVRVPTPKYLLAMKCRCFRADKDNHDLEDIKSLMSECDITTLEQIQDNFRFFYPENSLSAEHILRLKNVCAEKNERVLLSTGKC